MKGWISGEVIGKPRGKQRAMVDTRWARPRHYTPAQTVDYERQVKWAAAEAMRGRETLTGAVRMRLIIEIEPPTSWSAIKRLAALSGLIHPTVTPDYDNVAKAVSDGCNRIIYNDDKQICLSTIYKKYSGTNRVRFFFKKL